MEDRPSQPLLPLERPDTAVQATAIPFVPPDRHPRPRQLSIAEVAEEFGRSPRSIRRWIACGLLKPTRLGRSVFVCESELDRVIAVGGDNNDGY